MTDDRRVTIFRGGLLLDHRGPRVGHGLVARDGEIVDAGPLTDLESRYPQAAIEHLAGHALLPGTVNAHSHSFQSLLRGLGDDRPFAEWRAILYRFASRFDDEAVHVAALHAFAEMLRNGITTVVDFFYLHHGGNERALAAAGAARALGMRLVLARGMLDSPKAPDAFRETPARAVANCRALAAKLQGDELVSVIPAPHSPHGASAEMVRSGAGLAAEWGTPWHIHVAENADEVRFTRERYRATPLAWLARERLLDERVRIVHGVRVDGAEVRALSGARGGLVHCPGANLFLGDGVCPLHAYRREGVTVALGCDSGSANEQLSIFGEMRLAALLGKGWDRRGEGIDASSVFRMGTEGGAHATGLDVGRLAVGAPADLVALDLGDLSLQPAHRLLQNVVYSLHPSAIRHVYVDGEAVVRDGRLVRMLEGEIAASVERLRSREELWR